jgi:ADP-heptose:LPS heptosyltransferase
VTSPIPGDGRVLAIVYGHVADTMAAIPALRSLRSSLPGARIELLCLSSVAPIMRGCPHVDRVLAWDDFRRKGLRGARVEKAAVIARLAVRLRARRYGAVLVFHRSFRALRRLATLAGAPVVAGSSAGGDGYTHVAPEVAGAVESSRDENARVLAAVGLADDGGPVELWDDEADRAEARALLGERAGGPLVGLHPGSDWSCQQWLPDRFAAVGARLQREVGARVVVTGSPAEVGLQEEIADALAEEPVRCAGRTTLRGLAAVIRELDVLVCVNSAAAAVARAVGTPAVVLLGPEDSRLTGLVAGDGLRVVQPGDRLAPGSWCEFGRWGLLSGCESPMCRGLSGLDRLDPAAVAAEALALLGRPAVGAGVSQ